MSTNMFWALATQKCQVEKAGKKLEETDRKKSEEARKQKEEEQARIRVEEIHAGVVELRIFMLDEGNAAIKLLQASGRRIIFGESPAGGGFCTVYFMDGEGLQQSVETSGSWAAYSKDAPKPTITPITIEQAIEAAVNYGGKKATEVVGWLKTQLDKIAEEIMNQE